MKIYRVEEKYYSYDWNWELCGVYGNYFLTYEDACDDFEKEIKKLSKNTHGDNNSKAVVTREENKTEATILILDYDCEYEKYEIHIEEIEVR